MTGTSDVGELLRTQLVAARDHGRSEQTIDLHGLQVPVSVTSSSLRILVCSELPSGMDAVGLQLLDAVRFILGQAPDAVYTRRAQDSDSTRYCGLWGNPELSFHEEMSSLVSDIYAADNRVLRISERLRSYLVPNHPETWNPEQVDLWQRFWKLRLEDPEERDRIDFLSPPGIWDYFRLLAAELAGQTTAELPEGSPAGLLRPQIETLYRAAALTGYHVFLLQNGRVPDWRGLDFSRVSALVPEAMGWDSVPDHLLQVVNEVNISDIRASGDLFKHAAMMPPAVLDRLLLNADKCAVLGYTTGVVALRMQGDSR